MLLGEKIYIYLKDFTVLQKLVRELGAHPKGGVGVPDYSTPPPPPSPTPQIKI